MEKYMIENYPSQKGSHCSSTALKEVSLYYNNNISESMVFGLGSGLSFLNLKFHYREYSKIIVGRTPMLECDFFSILGLDYKWHSSEEFDWNLIKEYIKQNIPVLFIVDVTYLDFYKTEGTPFTGHTVVLTGYDEENNIAYVSDNFADKVLETNLKSFLIAISIPKPPFFKKNMWCPIKPFKIQNNLEQLIQKAIIKNANEMLQYENKYVGIGAIKRLIQEIELWDDLPNWEGNSDNVYRAMEVIGTGGGGFRILYKNFLEEAEKILPYLKKVNSVKRMEIISNHYKLMSKKFYIAGRKGDKKYLLELKEILNEIYRLEKEFWEDIQNNNYSNTIYQEKDLVF